MKWNECIALTFRFNKHDPEMSLTGAGRWIFVVFGETRGFDGVMEGV